MNFALWSTITGLLLITMALSTTVLRRLPLSSSMVYLGVGMAVSPLWLGLAPDRLADHAELIERITEIVVLVSLFTSGLKLSTPIGNWRWTLPARLATTSMLVTVGLLTLIGVYLLDLPIGAAVLLGGILAPTDPVLASEVQVDEPGDQDRLRFALTGEGGLNDGTAFPIVMLGLGLLGLHDLGASGWKWLAVDVVWSIGAGLAVGAFVGAAIGTLVLYLRKKHQEAIGLDNFIALGVIALTYGLALELHCYGFLAVFAAGCAFRHIERRSSALALDHGSTAAPDAATTVAESKPQSASSPDETVQRAIGESPLGPRRETLEALASHETKAGVFMAHAVLTFNEQIERIGEVAAVVIIGTLLWSVNWALAPWWFPALLLFVVRPIATQIGLIRSVSSRTQRGLIGWFGIRGIGSLYYLAYAINHGVTGEQASTLTALTLAVVVTSIVLHGISVTPLMTRYAKRRRKGSSDSSGADATTAP